MHNTERCVDQCYQKSEGCVLDCGKSEMTECERTCITKLTQCTAGDSGEDNEKNGEKKEEKRGDGMSIMFSQFKIGHEAKATKGCVLAAGVFDVQSTTKGHFSLAASTTARQHAQTVFTILRRLQVDPLGVIVVEAGLSLPHQQPLHLTTLLHTHVLRSERRNASRRAVRAERGVVRGHSVGETLPEHCVWSDGTAAAVCVGEEGQGGGEDEGLL
ncbi:hypothetical protein BLNAU_10554 [Blattamonas nauphoetae]|uniref:AWS domain-containing protein n=1 Tax=Blattamonas nauphoetae TaxID=2049346 RepID=A0ABQ9XSR7_9EUKA|nr:hypothetical protein BLNAU_22042 [Blattamonas nauphoetae]KAK2954534.1 hypothetical protein BLNAU_10554 [Blattamonas nauphoetae]